MVTPFLVHYAPGEQYARERRVLGFEPLETDEEIPSSGIPSPSDIRYTKLMDSGLSGMLTGGALRGFQCESACIILFLYLCLSPSRSESDIAWGLDRRSCMYRVAIWL